MNLFELEYTLRKQRIPITRAADGAVVIKYETYGGIKKPTIYPIHFTEAGDGNFRGKIYLRRILVKEIEYVDAFCRFVSEKWVPTYLVFDRSERRFSISTPVDADHFGEDVAVFLCALYQIEPLCLFAGKTGKWVENFHAIAELTMLDPSDLPN